jgi:hypothetical protein
MASGSRTISGVTWIEVARERASITSRRVVRS